MQPAALQVVFCKLSKLQLKLYEHFLQSKPVKALLASTMGENGTEAPRRRKGSQTVSKDAAAGKHEIAADGDGQVSVADMLAPLPAITALKKLCCHPDLIWSMLHKHAPVEQLTTLRAAQQRMSVRVASQVGLNIQSSSTMLEVLVQLVQ